MNSSRSTPKTQSRAMSGDRIESGKSRLSGQSMPSPRMSSNISPASSISDWSSESVSSISSTQHISHSSRDSLSRSYSSKKVPVDFDSPRCMDHDDKTSDGSANRGLPGNSTSRASTGTVVLHQTSKPSGLRLPSPKIGFFDGVSFCHPFLRSNFIFFFITLVCQNHTYFGHFVLLYAFCRQNRQFALLLRGLIQWHRVIYQKLPLL